jgi:hypothetical protein
MIDLFCGLGGWADGGIAEGYDVVGFDIERHVYGEHKYPAQLVIQDVLTLDGAQFKDAALIVASPPCQEFSYMAMPWKVAKQRAADYRSGVRDVRDLTRLFDACFRIQREAIGASGHHIPLVVENVRGTIPWVGRSRWNYGSYHLWGDVPALMPMTLGRQVMKDGIAHCPDGATNFHGQKTAGHPNKRNGHRSTAHLTNPAEHIKWGADSAFSANNRDHIKGIGKDLGEQGFNVQATERFGNPGGEYRRTPDDKRQHIGARRKFASAMIAKIPLPLARHIARTYYPLSAIMRAEHG